MNKYSSFKALQNIRPDHKYKIAYDPEYQRILEKIRNQRDLLQSIQYGCAAITYPDTLEA